MNDFKWGEVFVKGDISDTYEGVHLQTNTQVLLLVVDKHNNEQSVDFERFEELQSTVTSLTHPSLLKYHNIFQDDQRIVAIMEHPTGENLREYLVKRPEKRIGESEAKAIFRQLVLVTEYLLTNNIVHKNFNLRNIYVDQNQQVKVGDFLICTKIKPIYKPHSDTSAYHFYAPECWLEEHQTVEASADIWSLGVILYAMTCGCYPFGGKHELDIFLNVKRARFSIPKFLSEECASLIRTMLSPNAADRPSTQYIRNHPWFTGQRVQSPTSINIHMGNVMLLTSEPEEPADSPESGTDLPFGLDSPQDQYYLPLDPYSPLPMTPSTPYTQSPPPASPVAPESHLFEDPKNMQGTRKRSASLFQELYQIHKANSESNISPAQLNGIKSLELDDDPIKRVAGRQRANSHSPTRRLGRQGRRRSNSTNTPSQNKSNDIPGFDKIFLPQTELSESVSMPSSPVIPRNNQYSTNALNLQTTSAMYGPGNNLTQVMRAQPLKNQGPYQTIQMQPSMMPNNQYPTQYQPPSPPQPQYSPLSPQQIAQFQSMSIQQPQQYQQPPQSQQQLYQGPQLSQQFQQFQYQQYQQQQQLQQLKQQQQMHQQMAHIQIENSPQYRAYIASQMTPGESHQVGYPSQNGSTSNKQPTRQPVNVQQVQPSMHNNLMMQAFPAHVQQQNSSPQITTQKFSLTASAPANLQSQAQFYGHSRQPQPQPQTQPSSQPTAQSQPHAPVQKSPSPVPQAKQQPVVKEHIPEVVTHHIQLNADQVDVHTNGAISSDPSNLDDWIESVLKGTV